MRKLFLSILLISNIVLADDVKKVENYKITEIYYNNLINEKPLDLASLNLFINLMPKGGDIHHHYSGSIYAETYLDWVDQQGLCIYINDTPKHKKFTVEKNNKINNNHNKNCLSSSKIRANDEIYSNVIKTWSNKDYNNHYNIQLQPDLKFFNTFSYFSSLSADNYNKGLLLLKQRAINENVSYIETMLSASPTLKIPRISASLNKSTTKISNDEKIKIIKDGIFILKNDTKFTKEINDYSNKIDTAAFGLNDDNFTIRFQSYVFRNNEPDIVLSGLYSAFESASNNKNVVAVNIVGPENGFISMRDYNLHMLMFKVLKEEFPTVNLSLHSGELVLGMVPPEGLKYHIRHAIEVAGAKRIGHGIDITFDKDPISLLKLMNKNKIAVEINLTSNYFILGIKPNEHPIQLYQKFNVPYIISTDDSGVSRNNLSNEYLKYATHYQKNYQSLKNTVYRSIIYSFLDDKNKKNELLKLDHLFEIFESKIAAMY
ncbi:MAG: Aminodeoxyfutalosine deaminase [Acinetobacter bereziniae]|uniref:adenosine deaminase n=1 Tax=Acinetobacter bereziniae TaxID=106648 RepID=A0A833PFL5_ACIBZ|nr:MAG: Aminodeoxyfutalosine deaminase [Acinetobacter bereziniae]